MKKIKKQFLCPNCQTDLTKTGITNIQDTAVFYHGTINKKGEIIKYREEIDKRECCEAGEFRCAECNQELDYEKLGISI